MDKKTPKSAQPSGDSTSLAQIQDWLKQQDVAALAEAAEQSSGAIRKAARRALQVLRSRGVSAGNARVAQVFKEPDELQYEAFLLPPDGLGNLLLAITAHRKASRYTSAFVYLNDDSGVLQVEVGQLSHSQLKQALQKARPGPECRPTVVPVSWARSRIAQARKRQQEQGLAEPLGMRQAESLLSPVPETVEPHPFDGEGLTLSLEDAKEQVADSAKLHTLPEFVSWFPPKAATDDLLRDLGTKLTPGEKPSEEEFQQLLRAAVADATDRYFTPEVRERLVTHLKDCALSILSRLGESKALEVAALIEVVPNAGLITDPPSDVPFLRAFFDKAVALMLARGNGRLQIPVAAPLADASDTDNAEPAGGL